MGSEMCIRDRSQLVDDMYMTVVDSMRFNSAGTSKSILTSNASLTTIVLRGSLKIAGMKVKSTDPVMQSIEILGNPSAFIQLIFQSIFVEELCPKET